jgi:hypothetical protein
MTLGSVAPPTVAEIVTFFKYENNQTDESHICLKKKSFGMVLKAHLLSTFIKRRIQPIRALAFIQSKMFTAIKTSYFSVISQK